MGRFLVDNSPQSAPASCGAPPFSQQTPPYLVTPVRLGGQHVITKRDLLRAGIGLMGALSATPLRAAVETQSLLTTGNQRHMTTVRSVPMTARRIALTFDDGPHSTRTPALLDLLRAENVRATFFVIGARAEKFPDLLRRMRDEGHEIGNHTYGHPNLAPLDDAAILDEVDQTSEVITSITGDAPRLFRPPYGQFKPAQRQMLHTQRDLTTVLWSVDPEDWRRPGAAEIARRILWQRHQGAIVLSHDIYADTLGAMPRLIGALKDDGFEMETVSGLMGATSPRKDAAMDVRAPRNPHEDHASDL